MLLFGISTEEAAFPKLSADDAGLYLESLRYQIDCVLDEEHILLTIAFLVHRLNTFPLMHLNFLHMIFNVLALTPLLERFEAEFGTLVTLALFTGREQNHTSLRKIPKR